MADDREREQQVGRKRGEELRHRLHPLAPRAAAVPTQTPIGTQMTLASAISTTTRQQRERAQHEDRRARSRATEVGGAKMNDPPERQQPRAR